MKVGFENILVEPSPKAVCEKINKNWRRRVIIIILEGRVHYTGRAKSKLGKGQYLLISKPDGTLLLHGPEGRNPINWQPSGSKLRAKLDERLEIISVRTNPKEKVQIIVSKISIAIITKLEKGEFTLWENEKAMVNSVFANPELLEEGFHPIRREAQTPYGKIDLVGRNEKGELLICEFKRGKAGLSSVSQLKRYLRYYREINQDKNIRGIIVSPEITSSANRLVRKYDLEFKALSTPNDDKLSLKDFLNTE